MQVIRRDKAGTVVAKKIIGSTVLTAPPVKVEPKKEARKPNAALLAIPQGASDGQKLAIRLYNLIHDTSLETNDRNKKAFALGKFARDLGLGDPDASQALVYAKSHQASAEQRDGVDNDIFERWSTYFIGGVNARRVEKGSGAPKAYMLYVEIGGETKSAAYGKFGEAERAAMRWWVLKSETGDHHGMRVWIDTRDLAAGPDEDGQYPVIERLRHVVTYEMAASRFESQRRRESHGPTCFAPKTAGRTLGFGVKVHEDRAVFSRG